MSVIRNEVKHMQFEDYPGMDVYYSIYQVDPPDMEGDFELKGLENSSYLIRQRIQGKIHEARAYSYENHPYILEVFNLDNQNIAVMSFISKCIKEANSNIVS